MTDHPTTEKTTPVTSARMTLLRAAVVLVSALLLGVALPFFVNHATGTLHSSGVLQRLKPEQLAKQRDFDELHRKRQVSIHAIDERLVSAPNGIERQPIAELIQLRDTLTRLDQEPAPFVVSGYYLDDSMALWPLYYTGLGLLIVIIRPGRPGENKRFFGKTMREALFFVPFIFVFARGPTWFRNTQIGQIGRKVYAYPNLDVSLVAFACQEFMGLLYCGAIAIVWVQWLTFFDERALALARERDFGLRSPIVVDGERALRLHDTFLHWQLGSIALAIAFMYSTFFLWRRVEHDADLRYVANAVAVHTTWVATWVIMSAPLFITWRDWTSYRVRLLSAVAATSHDESSHEMIEMLDKLSPVSFWNVVSSTVAAIASLILPLLQRFT
jgi:hypothetical protein